jgi:hypothetical protein
MNSTDLKFDLSKSNINNNEKEKLLQLLHKYENVFATGLSNIGKTAGHKHTIHTYPDATPVRRPFYRTGPAEKIEIERQTKELLDHKLIDQKNLSWHIAQRYPHTKFH